MATGTLTETITIQYDVGSVLSGDLLYLSPNGSYAAIVYPQKGVLVYDLQDGTFHVFDPADDSPTILGWHADNKHLATMDGSGTFGLYNVFGVDNRSTIIGIQGYPSGLRLNQGATKIGFFGSSPSQLDLTTYKEYVVQGWNIVGVPYTYGNDVVTCTDTRNDGVIYSRDLTTLVSKQLFASDTLDRIVGASLDNSRLVFHNLSKKRTTVIDQTNGSVVKQFITGEPGDDNSERIQISSDGLRLALFGRDYGVCYDVETGSIVDIPDSYLLRGSEDGSYQMSPNGTLFIGNAFGNSLRVYNTVDGSITVLTLSNSEIIALATFTRDGGSLIGVGRFGTVNRWRLPDFSLVDAFQHGSAGKENLLSMSLDYDAASNSYALGLVINSRAEVIHRNITSVVDDEQYRPTTLSSSISTTSDQLTIVWSGITSYSIHAIQGTLVSTAQNENANFVNVSLTSCPTGTYVVILTDNAGRQIPVFVLKN